MSPDPAHLAVSVRFTTPCTPQCFQRTPDSNPFTLRQCARGPLRISQTRTDRPFLTRNCQPVSHFPQLNYRRQKLLHQLMSRSQCKEGNGVHLVP
ncbi:hypothetical protein C8Q73DRAFT_679334 [Cubamyces lactineus]|nr:hypothetical protein C8Q73DRAFT_679334 [Cubamyces lactineus]